MASDFVFQVSLLSLPLLVSSIVDIAAAFALSIAWNKTELVNPGRIKEAQLLHLIRRLIGTSFHLRLICDGRYLGIMMGVGGF